jgi:DNA-binding transcriptional MocR family regulator
MSIKRRKAIANIIKNNDIWMIDDDVYGFLTPNLPAISSFAQDHSFYLSSLSKCIFPGLRVGFIVSPESFKQRVEATIRNTIWMPVPISLALASKLIFSGHAFSIQKRQSEIATKRQTIAKRVLKNVNLSSQVNSFHMWLELPDSWTSDHFSKALEERGVLVSSAKYFKVEAPNKDDQIIAESNKPYIRLSLMAANSDDELTFALNIINQLLQEN